MNGLRVNFQSKPYFNLLWLTKFSKYRVLLVRTISNIRGVFTTISDIYDEVFPKTFTKICKLILQKNSIIDVSHDPKYLRLRTLPKLHSNAYTLPQTS